MPDEKLQQAMEQFVLSRINEFSAAGTDELQVVFDNLHAASECLKETLSPQQLELFTQCVNAYSLLEGEMQRSYPDVSAPGEGKLEDEYPSGGPMTQEFNRKLAGAYSVIGKTAERIWTEIHDVEGNVSSITQTVDSISTQITNIDGRTSSIEQTVDSISTNVSDIDGRTSTIEQTIDSISTSITDIDGRTSAIEQTVDSISTSITDIDGRTSTIEQTVDELSFSVSDPIVTDTGSFVKLTLTVGGNAHTGIVKIDGNLDISGELSAEALYAAYGDIANLDVDRLRTSRRIPKYLSGDTSDDQYINIQGQQIRFIQATCTGGDGTGHQP